MDNYKPRKISQIMKSDSKVALIGNVADTSENAFSLKDDNNKIEIFSNAIPDNGKLVRVFCSVIDGKLKADVIQNLEGLDLNLFKNVEELYNKSGI